MNNAPEPVITATTIISKKITTEDLQQLALEAVSLTQIVTRKHLAACWASISPDSIHLSVFPVDTRYPDGTAATNERAHELDARTNVHYMDNHNERRPEFSIEQDCRQLEATIDYLANLIDRGTPLMLDEVKAIQWEEARNNFGGPA